MKKLILPIAALILSVALYGCSKNESSSQSETTIPEKTEETTDIATTIPETPKESGEDKVATGLSDIAEAALGAGEWPVMAEINDADIILEDFEIDINDEKIENIYIKKCPMSATMAEIIIIKAKSGEVDYAIELLNTRKERLINKFSYYPSDKEIAEGAVIGSKGDFAYLLAAESAQQGEAALINAIG